jgi:cysteine rich repeat protein
MFVSSSEVCRNLINAAGGGAKLRAACADDLQRFCPGVQPGKGHLIQCLSAHTRGVSAACENMITTMRPQRGTSNSIAQNPAAQPAAPVIVGNSPPTMGSIVWTGCPKALRRGEKRNRCLEVLGLSPQGVIGRLQLVFPEVGRVAGRAKEYPEQKTAAAAGHTPGQASGY